MMDIFSKVLDNEIKPGEEILWRDQPIPELLVKSQITRKNRNDARMCTIAFILSLGATYKGYNDPTAFWIFILIAIVSLLGLASIVGKKLRLYSNVKQWLYVITNQRIIILALRPKVTVMSYSRTDIITNNYSKSYKADGSGFITFKGFKTITLQGLKNVQAVCDVIDKLAAEAKPKKKSKKTT